MATTCPLCQKGTLKKAEKFVYCSERKVKKEGNKFKDIGCEFKIAFNQTKVFGDELKPADIKKLVDGETLTSSKGHTMTLDLENKDFFTKITFAEKEEDEDL